MPPMSDKVASSTTDASGTETPDGHATRQFLPEWFQPTARDVVVGWARQHHKRSGNQRFRELVAQAAPLYDAADNKMEKTKVIQGVVRRIREDSCGGGFVKQDSVTGRWYEIGDDKARDKVGHAIRRHIDEEKKRVQKKAKLERNMRDVERALANDQRIQQATAATSTTARELPRFVDYNSMALPSSRLDALRSLGSGLPGGAGDPLMGANTAMLPRSVNQFAAAGGSSLRSERQDASLADRTAALYASSFPQGMRLGYTEGFAGLPLDMGLRYPLGSMLHNPQYAQYQLSSLSRAHALAALGAGGSALYPSYSANLLLAQQQYPAAGLSAHREPLGAAPLAPTPAAAPSNTGTSKAEEEQDDDSSSKESHDTSEGG